MITNNVRPKLRAIGVQPIVHNRQRGYILLDPLRLAKGSVFVPQEMMALLALMDGTRDLPTLQATLAARVGGPVPGEMVHSLIAALDDAFLLDNPRAAEALQRAIEAYRGADARPPASAGLSYPDDPDALRTLLDGYLDALDGEPADRPGTRGVLSPHIDYQRGGAIYARTWRAAATAAREAERIVILGTDHASGGQITLTRQSYATPYGIMPTDQDATDRLSAALGDEKNAFADELHHRTEHSVELSLTWVHHMRGGEPCPTVPVLCGSFQDFLMGMGAPSTDAALSGFVEALHALAASDRTLFVASGDLAHVGPAFDTPPLGQVEKAALKVDDRVLLDAVCAGDAEGFFQMLKAERDRRNVCGLAPIYLMLRALGEARGEQVGYDRCPADDAGTSVVSVAGVVLE